MTTPRPPAGRAPAGTSAGRPRQVVAALAVVAVGGFAGVGALPGSVTATPTTRAARTVTGQAQTRTVTLGTGDKVRVTTDPSGAVRSAVPVDRAKGPYLTQHVGADTYIIPARALGKNLDRSRFDVSALVAGRPAGDTVHPHFPMRTVSIKVTDAQGRPTDADLGVVNVDDSRKYVGFPYADTTGETRISVPDGRYALMAYQPKFDAQGNVIAERTVYSQFTVAGATTSTTVDLSRATHTVTVATPRPAVSQSIDLAWARGSSDSYMLGWDISTSADHPIYTSGSPTGPGAQHYYVHSMLTSPADAAKPYQYDVEFPNDGAVPTSQHYRATANSLATVDDRYYSDKPGRVGDSVWFQSLPWETVIFRQSATITQPLQRTEYLSTGPTMLAEEDIDAVSDDSEWGGPMMSGERHFQAGQHLRVDWLRGPLAPGIPADIGDGYYACGACRIDDTLSLSIAPVTDSTPDHNGWLDDPSVPGTVSTSHFQLYRGSTKVADLTDEVGGSFDVPAADAKYRMVYDQTRVTPWTRQSTRTHTEWGFSSKHSGSTTVPARWNCGDEGNTHCSPISLLQPRYQLTQGMDGSVKPGPDSMLLTLDHSPGAAQVPVEQAVVSVSYDDGTTWTPTKVRDLGTGKFRATWTNPASAAGSTVAIKVTGRDASGATVSQTVHDALTVTAG